MAKKKKRRNRPKPEKPLLSLTGVLHLQKSFVPPTQESGLLNTVGGKKFGTLILGPNYGYGIPHPSTVQSTEHGNTPDKQNKETDDGLTNIDDNGLVKGSFEALILGPDYGYAPDPPIVNQVPNQNKHKETAAAGLNHIANNGNEPTVELIQVNKSPEKVGGSVNAQQAERENPETFVLGPDYGYGHVYPGSEPSDQPMEFGRQTTNIPVVDENNKETDKPMDPLTLVPASDSTVEDIQAYYKDYCKTSVPQQPLVMAKNPDGQTWSWLPDPFSEQPIEFGHNIGPDANNKEATGGFDNIDDGEKSIIELARMAQRARRAMEAASLANQRVYGPSFPSTEAELAAQYYDPLPMEIVPSSTTENLNLTKDTTMEQYWEYVKESPRDFNRWCYLIQHAEAAKNITECRKAYGAFLPLFPYCFGYWKRYSDLEKGHLYFHRALAILHRGLEFNPLSIDLWLTYLKLFSELHAHQENFETMMQEQYERALDCAGMEFRSDSLWDSYIDWEFRRQSLRNVFGLYRRLLRVPTRLYNRHWDNFKALVRDHHPRDFLLKTEYELLRKKGCKVLKFKYKEEPDIEPGEIVKTSKPEDKLMAHVKEKIILKLEKTHNAAAAETDKRWDFEDKIKRPYFHTKPLDKGQLRNWENYLNFEISEGDRDRVVLLFERCLVSCAKYEQFWCKYARYLEKFHRKESNAEQNVSVHFQKSVLNFDIASSRTKEIAEEEATVEAVTLLLNSIVDQIVQIEEEEKQEIQQVMETLLNKVCACVSDNDADQHDSNNKNINDTNVISIDGVDSVNKIINHNNNVEGVIRNDVSIITGEATVGSVALSGHSELPPNSVEQMKKNENAESVSSFSSLLSVPVFPLGQYKWHEAVRDVYKRACIVHCPDKPTIRLQWAAFEEEIGNIEGARDLIQQIIGWYPNLLDAKAQLIELERRAENPEQVSKLFETYLKNVRHCSEYSNLAMKYARFIYKELGKPDKALAILRKAVKKDKGNHLLYNSVFNICHERFPSDRKGAAAALELALQSKDVKNEHKLQFVKKKIIFLQEHGELRKYRDAIDQLYELQDVVHKEKSAEAASSGEMFQNQTYRSPMIPMQQSFPKSVWDQMMITQDYVPIEFEPVGDDEAAQAAKRRRTSVDAEAASSSVYKRVPPTSELCYNGAYGYGNHPDSKLQEHLSHQEYDNLVARGYSAQLKDKAAAVTVVAGNKGSQKRKTSDIPMYIIPPRGTFLMNYLLKPKQS